MRRVRGRTSNRLGLAALGVFVVLLAAAGISAFKTLTFVSKVSTADVGENIRSIVQEAPVVAPLVSPAPQPAASQRVNILLLGFGGPGHDGPYLTDSIMVLSVDRQTRTAAMISIPRDTWVKVPYQGEQGSFYKVNTAYAIGIDDQSFRNKGPDYRGPAGGGNLASTVVGGMLGMRIDYWVGVDFHAFKSVVDALGGVDVNVEKAFTDYQYPRNDNPAIDPGWMTVHFNAGTQHMTGERALQYSRSRHSLEDGTDFGRSKRQQRLILAIKNKALTPEGVARVFGLMDALSNDFKTNMTIGQMREMADLARTIDISAIDHISIDDTNFLAEGITADGQDVLVPQARSWAPLRTYVASALLDPAVKSENATVQLLSGGDLSATAGTATSQLKDLGLQLLPPESDASAGPESEIHDFTHGQDPSTVSYLAELFGAKVFWETPTAADHPDIKIILGSSYRAPNAAMDGWDPGVRVLSAAMR
jgi:LCP family protein required for cell wall assembly